MSDSLEKIPSIDFFGFFISIDKVLDYRYHSTSIVINLYIPELSDIPLAHNSTSMLSHERLHEVLELKV